MTLSFCPTVRHFTNKRPEFTGHSETSSQNEILHILIITAAIIIIIIIREHSLLAFNKRQQRML